MEIRIAEDDSELEVVGGLMLQLRSGYDLRGMVSQIEVQQERGYTVAYGEEDGRAVCAAGFVIETRLAWGKHMSSKIWSRTRSVGPRAWAGS